MSVRDALPVKQLIAACMVAGFTSGAVLLAETGSHSFNTAGTSQSSDGHQAASESSYDKNKSCLLTLERCGCGDVTCFEPPEVILVPCIDLRCRENNGKLCSGMPRCVQFTSGTASDKSSSDTNQENSSSDKSSSEQHSRSSSSKNNPGDTSNNPPILPPFPPLNLDQPVDNSGTGNQNQQRYCYDGDGNKTWDPAKCDFDVTRRMFQPSSKSSKSSKASLPSLPVVPVDNSDTSDDMPEVKEPQDQPGRDERDLPPAVTPEVDQKIEQRFFDEEVRNRELSSLLESASRSLERIQLLEKQDLPESARTVVSNTHEWLQMVLSDFSVSDPSIRAIQTAAGELKERLQVTQMAVVNALPPAPKQSSSVLTDKMDKLFDRLPPVFAVFPAAGVDLPGDSVIAYQEAVDLYASIKPKCAVSASACSQLSGVITKLEVMVKIMEETADKAGRPELKDQIDAILSQ